MGESLEVLVISTAEDGSEQTQDLCAQCWKDLEERKMEPEPSETNSHVHGKEVDCNTNPFGDGWTTSLAVR